MCQYRKNSRLDNFKFQIYISAQTISSTQRLHSNMTHITTYVHIDSFMHKPPDRVRIQLSHLKNFFCRHQINNIKPYQ
uniref:Uncharacterized protein n=1 Tax=Arundo donax TaxID=35708 RepID=A0A0A9D8M7_ARUDO